MGASRVAEPTSASPPRRDERGESRRRRWEDERAGEGAKERACERDTWRRERSRDWLSRLEKPAWLLDRPALRSVLHCAPCEAELSRFTLPLSLAANRRFVRVRPFERDPVRVPVGKRTAVHQEIVSDNSVFAPIYVSERVDGRKERIKRIESDDVQEETAASASGRVDPKFRYLVVTAEVTSN